MGINTFHFYNIFKPKLRRWETIHALTISLINNDSKINMNS